MAPDKDDTANRPNGRVTRLERCVLCSTPDHLRIIPSNPGSSPHTPDLIPSYPGSHTLVPQIMPSYPGSNTFVPRISYPRTPDHALVPRIPYPRTLDHTLVPRIPYPRTPDHTLVPQIMPSYPGSEIYLGNVGTMARNLRRYSSHSVCSDWVYVLRLLFFLFFLFFSTVDGQFLPILANSCRK